MGNETSTASGGAPAPAQQPVPTQNDTVKQIRVVADQREKLEAQRAHYEKQIHGCLVQAKAAAKAKDQRKAKLHLKKKAMLTAQLGRLDGQIDNLMALEIKLGDATTNKDMISVMASTHAAIKSVGLDADKAADIMDDLAEEVAMQDELSEQLATPMGMGGVDEDELDDEFEAMMAEADDEEAAKTAMDMPAAPSTPVAATATGTTAAASAAAAFPEAPSGPVAVPAGGGVDDELAALEAELAM
jgi:hypothetical protein